MMLQKLYEKTAGLGMDSAISRYLLHGKYPILSTQGAVKLMCVFVKVVLVAVSILTQGAGKLVCAFVEVVLVAGINFDTGCRNTSVCVCFWRW
jgi:hypothetical protein